MNRDLVCDICGKTAARRRKISRSYGQGTKLLVIENIPVIDCRECGETYLEAETVRAIERIKKQRGRLAKERAVPVASLQ